MINLAFQIAIIVALTLLNGLFAMSETALVSSRKARLGQRAEAGDRGARTAMELADEPTRFLSTVQIGISLIGVLAGAFGGATLAEPARRRLGRRTWACAIQLGGSLRGRGGRHHLRLADNRRARTQPLGAQRPGGCVLARGPAYAIPDDLGLPRRLAPFGLDRGGAQASRGAPLRRPARHRAGVRSPPCTASFLYTTSLSWLPAQNASGG